MKRYFAVFSYVKRKLLNRSEAKNLKRKKAKKNEKNEKKHKNEKSEKKHKNEKNQKNQKKTKKKRKIDLNFASLCFVSKQKLLKWSEEKNLKRK